MPPSDQVSGGVFCGLRKRRSETRETLVFPRCTLELGSDFDLLQSGLFILLYCRPSFIRLDPLN